MPCSAFTIKGATLGRSWGLSVRTSLRISEIACKISFTGSGIAEEGALVRSSLTDSGIVIGAILLFAFGCNPLLRLGLCCLAF